MKDLAGTPGTLSGLSLRILQCVLAIASIASMVTAARYSKFTAYCYLIAAMGLLVIWSFSLAFLDAYSLIRKKVLRNPIVVTLYVIGDLVISTLSLAAASAAAGITVLFFNDLGHCSYGEQCQKYQASVVLAFMSWLPIAISSLIMLSLVAAH
ncbi:hypothetical protein ACFE04_005958 [Oxalis oulophora]